jgi:hypothetical protein
MARPFLDPTSLPHPWVQGACIAVMVATGIGVRLGVRPARWLARTIGYGVGIGSFIAYSKSGRFDTLADSWVAALWALEAGLMVHVLNRIGWGGDDG